jgi:hypothetical protein
MLLINKKHELFVVEVFTQSNPVWVGDLETRKN